MSSFRILSEAAEELEACVNYYNSQRPGLGTEFLNEFERTANRIMAQPSAGRAVGRHIRKSRSTDFLATFSIVRRRMRQLSLPLRIGVEGPFTGLVGPSRRRPTQTSHVRETNDREHGSLPQGSLTAGPTTQFLIPGRTDFDVRWTTIRLWIHSTTSSSAQALPAACWPTG